MSSDSSKTDSPAYKKLRKRDEDQDEENLKRVSDFMSKHERKSKYSQTKLNFTKLSTKQTNK